MPAKEIEAKAFSVAETSLEKLGVKKVNCIMLHRGSNLFENGDIVAKAMENLIKKGYTDTVGVSVYGSEELEKMFEKVVVVVILHLKCYRSGLHFNTFIMRLFLLNLHFLKEIIQFFRNIGRNSYIRNH